MALVSGVLGASLPFTSLEQSWLQHAMTVLWSCSVWIMSWLLVFTCGAMSAAANSIGDELAQVRKI
jgi:hypothetical protein